MSIIPVLLLDVVDPSPMIWLLGSSFSKRRVCSESGSSGCYTLTPTHVGVVSTSVASTLGSGAFRGCPHLLPGIWK